MKSSPPQGLTYVEVLVSIVLILLVLVPALQALGPGIQGSNIHRTETDLYYRAEAMMADVLAKPFDELDTEALTVNDPTTPTTYSDSAGTTNRRLVFLSRYDGDNTDGDGNPFTGTDEDLLWVKVEIEATNQSVEKLTSLYDV